MLLSGKKGLVLNVTNKNSIGWAIAVAAHEQGAFVGVGAQNERMLEKVNELIAPYERMSAFVVDFSEDEQLDQLARDVATRYGKIDFFVHSAAFGGKDELTGRFINTSRAGFAQCMDISVFSLIAACRVLEDLFNEEASVITLSYLGSQRIVGSYNVMGVAKAALESSIRYLSENLGHQGIRVNTISPGPINTVSARGVPGLLDMIKSVHDRSPLKRQFTAAEVAGSAVYLLSDLSKGVTGQIIYVDNGFNIVGM